MKDRYLFYESTSDQYVGWCASGLATDTVKNFEISQPSFDFTGLESGEGLKRKEVHQVMAERQVAKWYPKEKY
jgi:hypothetical protein